jgi:hypothetical protein
MLIHPALTDYIENHSKDQINDEESHLSYAGFEYLGKYRSRSITGKFILNHTLLIWKASPSLLAGWDVVSQ